MYMDKDRIFFFKKMMVTYQNIQLKLDLSDLVMINTGRTRTLNFFY